MINSVISYNEREVGEGIGSKGDINNGYDIWIDIVDPDSLVLQNIQKEFRLDSKSVEKIKYVSKIHRSEHQGTITLPSLLI